MSEKNSLVGKVVDIVLTASIRINGQETNIITGKIIEEREEYFVVDVQLIDVYEKMKTVRARIYKHAVVAVFTS